VKFVGWPPLRGVEPDAALDDLAPVGRALADARIVGLGESTHGVAEELTVKHRLLRLLVEQLGFRSVAWEEDWTVGRAIDAYIGSDTGDLAALMGQMSPQWQSRQVADVLRWLRAFNVGRPDEVRIVGVTGADALVYRDAHAAQNLRWWVDRTGDKTVYWAATPHTANAPRLRIGGPPQPDLRFSSAGSYLRGRYGPRYRSVGVTVGHGVASLGPGQTADLAEPAAGRFERPLRDSGITQFVLDLHAPAPPNV
jgi:erythromycin esterase-like protein